MPRKARALFLADGASDLPLAVHLERLCVRHGQFVEVVPVPHDRLPGAGRTVWSRVAAAMRQDADFDYLFVHRDAEGQEVIRRQHEVRDGVERGGFSGPVVPVIPIRMTEAWLLLDESAIRRVAGRPSGREPLDLPLPQAVEAVPDPKRMLKDALVKAANVSGRRLKTFRRRFPALRRQLLAELDIDGPVRGLTAWQQLERDITAAFGEGECSAR